MPVLGEVTVAEYRGIPRYWDTVVMLTHVACERNARLVIGRRLQMNVSKNKVDPRRLVEFTDSIEMRRHTDNSAVGACESSRAKRQRAFIVLDDEDHRVRVGRRRLGFASHGSICSGFGSRIANTTPLR